MNVPLEDSVGDDHRANRIGVEPISATRKPFDSTGNPSPLVLLRAKRGNRPCVTGPWIWSRTGIPICVGGSCTAADNAVEFLGPQPGVPPEEAGAAIAAESSTGTWTMKFQLFLSVECQTIALGEDTLKVALATGRLQLGEARNRPASLATQRLKPPTFTT